MPNNITLDEAALDQFAEDEWAIEGEWAQRLIAQAREALGMPELIREVTEYRAQGWIKAQAWDIRDHTEYVLRQRIAELEGALEPFADGAKYLSDDDMVLRTSISGAWVRRAAEVLRKGSDL